MATRAFGRTLQENNDAGPAAKKINVKMIQGPVRARAVLGNLHNKPINVAVNKNDNILKKASVILKRPALRPRSKEHQKENVQPVIQPVKPQPQPVASTSKDESMDVDASSTNIEDLSMAFSSQLLELHDVVDIDKEDVHNPQLVSVYVNDIYKYLWQLENQSTVTANYLAGQKVNGRMRSILIDWLVQVHQRFSLLQETLFLTVALIDRYLQLEPTISKDELQLIGVTCMFIACKYEELYLPEVGDFAYVTDKAFSIGDILSKEVVILNKIQFDLSFPLPLHFLRRDSKAGQVDGTQHTLAKYLIELTLTDYSFVSTKASILAAAALYLSMHLIGEQPVWDATLVHYSKYSEKEVFPIACKIAALVIKSTSSKQQAVRTKYRSSKLMKIADLAELKSSNKLLRKYAEQSSLHG